MLDPDKDAPYDRPNLSKDYLAGTAPEAWIPLHSPAYYAKRNIDIVRLSAAAIDVGGMRLKLSDGSEREWDALLLAPGAEPVRLAMPVAPGANLHLLRTLADSRTIVAAAEAGPRAVIIGSSFIGLEVAASLRKREVAVQVVAPEDKPLARIMGPALGDFVRSVHEENGVEFCLGHTAKEIRPGSVVLDDGTELQADFVVMGVGVRPRVDLARNAGLAVENGIVADEFLQTSQPGIWAAGDAASWPDPHTGQRIRVEHWVLAERMGQTAARNILGARERFEAVPFFWSQHYGDTINYVGHGAGWDEASLDGNPADRDCAVTFRRGGKRIAVATIFRDVESLRVEAEMEREVE
jgi:NADPH-dependent 2,4-dienoyl-CoA reductase/sulfur reductase-like enzyme